MNEELISSRGNVSYRRIGIDALLSITKTEGDFPTIETIFQKAIGPIQEISGITTVAARLYNPEKKCFRLIAHEGMAPEIVKNLSCTAGESPIYREIMKREGPAVHAPEEFIRGLGYKTTVLIPLVAGDVLVGAVDLSAKNDYIPVDDELDWFALMGRILGSMIYQAQRSECLQSMAVLQERTRLANELHDDVAQLVRSMSWGLEEARITLAHKHLEQTDEILQNLETLVQRTSAYLREEMLSLRERVDANQGIIPILEGMLMRFERSWSIRTALVMDRKNSASLGNFLSPQAEVQLTRIVREALMNIRRHANAHSVMVRIAEDVDSLVISIIDDGIGFHPEDIPEERLGLCIIQERASSIGATVRIESVAGSGTMLIVKLPRRAGGAL